MFPVVGGEVTLRYEISGNVTFYDRRSKTLLSGNSDFGRVIELCDGENPPKEVLTALERDYGDPASLSSSLQEFFGRLSEEGVLTFSNAPEARQIFVCHCDAEFPLDSVYLEPTRSCNQRCIHCYAGAPSFSRRSPTHHDMSQAQFAGLFRELRGMGTLFICFTGGEPLVRPDFMSILEECHSQGLDSGIFTNGSLFDDGKIDALGAIGPRFIAISLDSVDPIVYEKIRGRRSLSAVLENIRKLLRKDLPVRINCILFQGLNSSNADLTHYLTFLRDEGIPPESITFDQFSPEGEGADRRHFLVDEDVAVDSVRQAFQVAYGWDPSPTTLSQEGMKSDGDYCGLGTSMLSIGHDGSMSLCPALSQPEHVIGHVTDGVAQAWRSSQVLSYFREKRHLSNEICQACDALAQCKGGCKAKSLTFNGDFNSPDPWMCAYFKGVGETPAGIQSLRMC